MSSENYYHARARTPIPPRRRHPKRWPFLIVITLIIATVLFFALGNHKKTVPLPLLEKQKTQLTSKLDTIIRSQPAKVGIAITDTKTGDTFTAGSTAPFQAASTGKLLTAVAYYSLVENHQASMSEEVGAWQASFQMKEMINISDNDSWHDLQNVVTDAGLAAYMKSHAIRYNVTDNTIVPAQMTKFLSLLANGKLIDSDDQQQLFSYMQQTNMEQMLPAITPTSVLLYHKYGLLDGMLADVGIMEHDGQTYTVAIYTQNTDDSDDLSRIVTIRELATTILQTIYPDVAPLSPPAPTSVDD